MEEALPAVAWVSIGTAVASLIVVPFVVHVIKQFIQARREARAAELAKVLTMYVSKIEHDERNDRMEETQARWQQNNADLLDTMRLESKEQEKRIVSRIDNLAVRVDNVFTHMGARGKL